MAKKRTGLDALREYEARSGRQTQSGNQQTGNADSSGGTWRSGLDALREYEASGGGQNVKNGPYNPDYRTNTRKATPQSYEAAYQQYKQYVAEYQKQTEFPRRVSVGTAAQQAGGSQKRDYSRMLGLNQLDEDMQPRVQAAQDIQKYLQFQRKVQTGTAAQQAATNAGQDYSRLIGLNQFDGELERRAAEWQRKQQAAQEAAALDQERGRRRTSEEYGKRIDALEAASDYARAQNAEGGGLPEFKDAYDKVNDGRETPMTLDEMQKELAYTRYKKAVLDKSVSGRVGEYAGDLATQFISGGADMALGGLGMVLGYLEQGANGAAAWTLRDLAKAVPDGSIKDKMLSLADDFSSYYTGESMTAGEETARYYRDELNRIGDEIEGKYKGVPLWIQQQMPSAGNMLFGAGLSGIAGVNNLVTLGLTSGGNSALEAKDKGASDAQALAYGVVAGGLEVFSERLFGGNPIYDADAGLVNQAVGKLTSNKTIMKILNSKAFDIASEGLEEVVTEVLDPVAEWAIYNGDNTEFADAASIGNAFLGGVFLSAVGNVADAPKQLQQARYERVLRTAGSELADIAQSVDSADVQEAAQVIRDKIAYGVTPDAADIGAVIDAMDQAGETVDVEQVREAVDAEENEAKAAQAEAAFQTYNQYADERDARQEAREAPQQASVQAVQEAERRQQTPAQTVIQADAGRRTEQYGQQETGSRNGEGRTESVYSGGQSRRMDAGSEIERTLERQGETVRLRNRARNIGAENISPAEAGLKGGDTTKSLLKIPVEAYGEHEKALQKAVEARGASLNIVMGRIRLANGTAVDEFIDTGTRQITVRADCTRWAMENLIDHALFHDLSTKQRNAAAQAVADRFSESELMAIAGQYVKRMRGVYEGMSEEALLNIATEEVLADAAGRMLRYTDADATKFTETVRGILNENAEKPTAEQEGRAKEQQAAQRRLEAQSAEKSGETRVLPDRYSISEADSREQTQDEITAEYQNTVHGILNGTVNAKGALLVGYTPEIYRKLGMPNLPFVVGSGHVYSIAKTQDEAKAEGRFRKNTNYHGLGERAVADILQAVKNPVMVISAKDVDRNATPLRSTHSVVALVDVGTNGKSLVVPVSITAQSAVDGTVMDVNMISSAYERNVSGLVDEAIAQFNSGENSIFYVTEKAATLAGEGVQFPRILQAAATSSNGIVRKFDSKINMSIENVTQSQQFKRWFGDWQNKPETASKVVNADGTPKVVYHQTGNDFTIFDVRKNGAGTRDNETPFGIFLKSSSRDIGLNGKKQMALYANIRNPLYARDRADLTRQLRELSPEYDAIRQEHAALDKKYKQKFEDAKKNFVNFLTEWKKNHPGESSRSLYGTPEFERVFDAEDSVVEEWTSKADALSVRAKEVLTDAIKQAGFDGVVLANDAGSWGRSTDAYIALSENQVKSATDNVGTFDRDNPDIRYSVAEDAQEADAGTEDAAKKAAEGVPIFNFDTKADWAYSRDPNPFYRLMGITPPGVMVGIMTQGARAADWAGNGKAYTKALLDFVTKPDRSTKTLTLQFPNADGTYRAETVQNTKFMQDVYKYYAETVPEEERLDEATFWMMRKRLAEGSIPTRIRAMSAEAKGQAWQESSRKDFKSTGALEKMGVKVERSVGRYGKTQTLIEMDKAFKQAKKEVNRAIERLGATAKEVAFARQIADGVFDMQDIPQGFSKRVVLSLVDYMNAEAALGEDRLAAQRKSIRQDTTAVLETLFKDVKDNKVQDMFTLNHRTAQRNMKKIFGDETGERINKAIFDPIKGNGSERIRFINRQFDDVREFADSTGRKSELTHEESILVQLVMEGKATEALLGDMPGNPQITKAGLKIADGMKASEAAKSEHLNKNEKQLAKMYASWVGALRMMADGKIDAVKIDNAAKAYTQKYNEFYAAINDFLVAHGYEPIGFIQNYAPHMQSEESRGALDSALKALGLNEDTVTLPTSIAGLTADFKPNKRWNPYFLHRTSETYNFDAAKGFESYVAYMSEVFYHTDDIMTVRALSDYLRRRYSSEEISFDIDRYTWLQEKLPDEQLLYLQQEGKLPHGTIADQAELDAMIEAELDKLYEDAKNKSTYSNLVVWLDNYANILAGKQTMGDRSTEADFGRKMLNLGNKATRGFGAAKVAGNIATILNQTSQLPIIVAEKGVRNTAAAVKDMVTGQLRKADFAMESDYLTSKKGVHFLVTDEKNMYEWALDKVGQAQEFADAMVSTIAVRAAYLEGIQKGMTHEQAMRYADKYGAAVMGDRSKGAKPVAFNSKSPVMQLVNTFQLEVANSWEHLTQDTAGFDFRQMAKKYGKDKAVKALAGVIVKYLIAAFIMNRLSDETYGGTPAQFDVLGITSNFVASGYGLAVNDALRTVMDDGWEKLTGERLFGTENEERSFDGWKAVEAAGGDIANDIPYLQNVSALIGWGDNSLPAAIPTKALDKWINAVKGGKSAQDVAKATFDVGTEVIPGGSQIKKTARGLDAMLRGGVYQGYGDQTKLRYPVDNKNIGKWIQAVVFGPNGLSETGRYYAGEERAIGEKQTTAYQAMIAAGADKEESYRLIRRISKLGDGEDSKLDKLNMLLSSKVSTAGRGAYYYLMMAGDKERERIDALTGENGVLGMDEYLKASQKKLQIDADESMKASEKADAFRQWANQQGYSAAQKRGVLDAFKFAQIIMEGGGHTELYQAATEGVSEYETLRADAIAAEMAGGKTKAEAESSVNSSLRSQMKQDFQDGLADEETAAAFLKEYCGAEDEHDVYWTLEEWKGGEGWKKYGQFLDAVDKGVLADTRKVAKEYMKHGVDKGDLSSQLTEHFKEAWLAATGDEATRLKNAYISAYKAIGGDADKARDNIIKWRREANKRKGDKK